MWTPLSLFTWCDRALAHAGFGLCPIALACRCVPCVKPALQVPSIASIAQRLDLRFYLRRIGRLRCSHGVLGVASMNVSPPCGALWAGDQLALTSSPKDRFSLYEHRADFRRRGHIQAKCQQFRCTYLTLKAMIVKAKIKNLWNDACKTYRTPTQKQKDAYGRFCMAMSGACFVGAVTLGFSAPPSTTYMAAKVIALVFWGVVLFVIGSVLSKGE